MENKKYIVMYIVLMLVYPMTSVVLPKYYGKIVSEFQNGEKINVTTPAILIIIVFVMFTMLNRLDKEFVPRLQAYIRLNVVKEIFENYKDKFEEQELGVLISKIVKLPILVRDLMYHIRNYVVPLVVDLPFVLAEFTIIDPGLGLIVACGIIASILVLIPKFLKCLQISLETDHESDSVHEQISELFENMLNIYSMNTQSEEIGKLEKCQDDVIKSYKSTIDCTNSLKMCANSMSLIITGCVLVYIYQLYRCNKIDMGDITSIGITGMYMFTSLGKLSGEIPAMIFDLGAYIHIQKYLDSLSPSNHIYKNFNIKDGQITFRNVNISYGDKQVLKNFNITLKPKESIAIIGQIGSGKSSLAKALLKLIPYEGNILVDDNDISEINPDELRSQILYVCQNPLPFNRTLYENIVYGNNDITKEKVRDIFRKYELDQFFNHDLDTKVGKKGGYLSGGQRQMIFLLRVLLTQKPIIILDEPTSSLDDKSSKYIMKMLDDILRNRTVLLITHDSDIGNLATKKLEL